MICPNCGGEFADWALKCPYCGSVNDAGAESAYMAHMEELKKRLDQVDEESEVSYRKTMSGSVKKVLILVGCILAAVVVILLVVFAVGRSNDRKEEEGERSQQTFEKEEFPKLDELYEAGDLDGILDEYNTVMTETDYDLYDWSHYYFAIELYEPICEVRLAGEEIRDGQVEAYDLAEGLYSALYLTREIDDEVLDRYRRSYDSNGRNGITADELETIGIWRDEAESFLENEIGWTGSEADAFYEKNAPDKFLGISCCFDEADKLIKEKGWDK